MLTLDIATNIDDIIGLLTDTESRHIPFAQSVALNKTAKEARAEVKRRLPDHFTLRRNWVERGVRARFSTKKNLRAEIYTADWFMEDQEVGGTRTPKKARHLFVPTTAIRRGGTGLGLPSKRPRTLLRQAAAAKGRKRRGRKKDGSLKGRARKPVAFIANTRKGGQALYLRTGPGRYPIKMLYKLEKNIRINPRWRFKPTVESVVGEEYRRHFALAMQKALKTAKGGAQKSVFIDHLIEHDGIIGVGGNTGGVLSALRR